MVRPPGGSGHDSINGVSGGRVGGRGGHQARVEVSAGGLRGDTPRTTGGGPRGGVRGMRGEVQGEDRWDCPDGSGF
ncbi:MAG: hypothetical protein ACE5R6_04485 [Candidatus Heimdallarchaeota archaeon]